MIPLRIYKLLALPQRCEPNSLYFIRRDEEVDLYTTSIEGVPALVWNGPRIKSVIDEALLHLDIPLQWSLLYDGPVSSPQAIDLAVQQSHAHNNMAVLTGLADASGKLQYLDQPVDSAATTITGLDGGHF